jgi:GT2 family glycosyltransferase
LPTVLGQTYPTHEVLVVDNPSPASAAVDAVLARHPAVKLVRPATNLGYAGGMNYGIERVNGDYVYLTEDDVLLAPDTISRLVAAASTVGDAILSGVIRNADDQSWHFVGANLRLGLTYRQASFDFGAPGRPLPGDPYPTEMVLGMMVFAPLSLLRRLGGFRSEYFMYFEDAELSLRARAAGVPLYVVPSARAGHLRPEIGPPSPLIEFHKLKNYFATCVRFAPPLGVALMAAKFFPYTTVRAAWQCKSISLLLKAWWWTGIRLPWLMSERATGAGRRKALRPLALLPALTRHAGARVVA